MNVKVGLKSKWTNEQLRARMVCDPDFVEIYLDNKDLEEKLYQVEENLRYFKDKNGGIPMTVHQPEKFKNKFLNLASDNQTILDNTFECMQILCELAARCNLEGVIIHPYWSEDEQYKKDNSSGAQKVDRIIKNLTNLKEFRDIILLENEISGCFSLPYNILYILKQSGFRLTLDFCHLFIACKDDLNFKKALSVLKHHIHYCHLADTDGVTDNALEIGKGVIDWSKIVDYAKLALIEVGEEDYIKMPKMLNSLNYFKKICRQNTI